MSVPFLKKYSSLLPILFLILVILISYWKLTTMRGVLITDDIFTSDIMNDAFPYRFYLGELLKSGQLPLWYPPVYGGFPLLARAEAGVAYPLNLLLFGLLPPYTALNLVILLTLIIAAAGMYLYVRELDADIAGGLIAGISFAYSGFMVAHLKHLSTVNAACWLPLGLYFIERGMKQDATTGFLQKAKPFMYLSLVVGMQNLAGHTQTAYYCELLYGAYFLFRFISARKKAAGNKKKHVESALPQVVWYRNPRFVWFAAAAVLAAGISAVQLIPTYELVTHSQRSGGVTFEYASNYAYDPANIVTFFSPYANGDIGNATYHLKSIFWEDYGYVGLVTILLAIYAAIALWKRPHVKFFAITSVVAYFLVLGPNTPVYEVAFHIVPGMKFFRFPTRFLLVVDASLAILAAFGATNLLSRFKKDKSPQIGLGLPGVVLVGLVVLDLLYFQMRQNAIADANLWRTPPETVQIIKQDTSMFRIYSPGASEAHKQAFHVAGGWEDDLQPYIDQRKFIQPSLNVLFGLSTADGYAQLTPNYVVDVWGDQNRGGWIYETAGVRNGAFVLKPAFLKIISMFNIKYLITPWPMASEGLQRIDGPSGVFMYRNLSVMPRAFMVPQARVVQGPDAAKAVLLSTDFNPSQEAVLYKDPGIRLTEDSLSSSVNIERYLANEVVVRTKAVHDALLVLSDTYYPGWKAYVDGMEREVLQANACQRAVTVPSGEHVVRFEFVSPTVRAGFGITLVSLLFTGGLLIASRKRGEPRG